MPLLETTVALLEAMRSKGFSLRQIAPAGGSVEYEWLKKFSAGKIPDPSVNRIQDLYERLQQMKQAA